MADIEIRRKHTRPLKDARAAIERVAEHLAEKFDVEYSETPSVVISKTTLPGKPKILVLPGR